MSVRSIVCLLLCLLTAQAQAGTITFSDNTFNNADWTLTKLISPSGSGEVTVFQPPSGGTTGSFRMIQDELYGSPIPLSDVWSFNGSIHSTYNPSTQGAILTLDYSESSKMFLGFGDGEATGAAIFQNGKYYFAQGLFTREFQWTSKSELNLTATSFWEFKADGTIRPGFYDENSHPDFSATGSVMELGFFRGNSTPYFFNYKIVSGIDDWSITLHTADLAPSPVPEPTSLGLLSIGAVALLARKIRRRQLKS